MKQPLESPEDLQQLAYNQDGLVPVVAQDATTGMVLMLAWANEEALARSLATGSMTYYSRSRSSLWTKGETSGNGQTLVALAADCDRDAVLATVKQNGPACHENTSTCWSDEVRALPVTVLGKLDALAAQRQANPQGRYTDALLADRNLVAEKIVEEAAEVARVLRGEENDDSLEHEAADLLYHLLVGLRAGGGQLLDVLSELEQR